MYTHTYTLYVTSCSTLFYTVSVLAGALHFDRMLLYILVYAPCSSGLRSRGLCWMLYSKTRRILALSVATAYRKLRGELLYAAYLVREAIPQVDMRCFNVTVATLSYLFMSVDPLLGMLKCCFIMLHCLRRAEVMQDVTAKLSKGNYAQAVATTRAAR